MGIENSRRKRLYKQNLKDADALFAELANAFLKPPFISQALRKSHRIFIEGLLIKPKMRIRKVKTLQDQTFVKRRSQNSNQTNWTVH